MKKYGIYIMLGGLVLTLITVYLYFSKQFEVEMNRFVMTIGNSFYFNWAPMIGISVMAIGEFILWESQNNRNLNEVWIKLKNKFKENISMLRLNLIYLSNLKLINMKLVKFLISIFNL